MLPPITPLAFSQVVHDILIIGGGTAGLTLATRLSEDPSLNIGVIEAGFSQFSNPLVNIPGLFGRAIGSEIDWNFHTVPQEHLNGTVIPEARGKMLGGSSGLNFMLWNRAGRQDYDDWEVLGNEGWGWDEVLHYSKKSEHYTPPFTSLQLSLLPTPPVNPAYHNTHGPLFNSFGKWFTEAAPSFFPTLAKLGIQRNDDPMTGDNSGLYDSLQSIEQANVSRSYSATAYLRPNLGRPNLKVLTGATATKVVLTGEKGKRKRATGVQFVDVDGVTHEVKAGKEVVLSAGSYQSVHLLELSGIGNCDILSEAGIECLVENKNVGENLQDHVTAGNIFEFIPGITTTDLFVNTTLLSQFQLEYDTNKTGPLTSAGVVFGMIPLSSFLSSDEISEIVELAPDETPLEKLLKKQLGNSSIPDIELLLTARRSLGVVEEGKTYLSLVAGLMHPFSTGSVHINTTSPLSDPVINPKFYTHAVDRAVMLHTIKFMDKIGRTSPLAELLVTRVNPPASGISLTDAEWWAHLINTTSTTFHPLGTCAMLPENKGGVVDARLRVYGVDGLRVVDASVIPKQIAAHPQATIYAIAEKATAIIKSELRRLRGRSKGI